MHPRSQKQVLLVDFLFSTFILICLLLLQILYHVCQELLVFYFLFWFIGVLKWCPRPRCVFIFWFWVVVLANLRLCRLLVLIFWVDSCCSISAFIKSGGLLGRRVTYVVLLFILAFAYVHAFHNDNLSLFLYSSGLLLLRLLTCLHDCFELVNFFLWLGLWVLEFRFLKVFNFFWFYYCIFVLETPVFIFLFVCGNIAALNVVCNSESIQRCSPKSIADIVKTQLILIWLICLKSA